MIEQTASFTAAKTMARLRDSRGGLNVPARVVRNAMTFHVAIAWTPGRACPEGLLSESCGGARLRAKPSFWHPAAPAQSRTAGTRYLVLLVVRDLIPPPDDDHVLIHGRHVAVGR